MTPPRGTTRALPALVLGLALALTGCGGDEASDDEPADTGISQEDFVEQANAICVAGNAEIGDLQLDPSDPATFEEGVVNGLVPNVQTQIDDIRNLGFPEGDQDTLDEIFSEAENALDDIAADPNVLLDGDPLGDVNARLDDYGLDDCGSSATP